MWGRKYGWISIGDGVGQFPSNVYAVLLGSDMLIWGEGMV
jgi:hypothetical protein